MNSQPRSTRRPPYLWGVVPFAITLFLGGAFGEACGQAAAQSVSSKDSVSSQTGKVADDTLRRDNVLQYLDINGKVCPVESVSQWRSRRDSIRQGVKSLMGSLPATFPDLPPAYETVEEVDCGTYLRRKIHFESQPGCQTPAYLCIPKRLLTASGATAAAVLCLHPTDNVAGHDVVVGIRGKPNRQYASELAERGYVTISPSYPLLADYQPDLNALGWKSGSLKAVWDNRRAIDLLQTLPFVRGESIGAIGHSLGGHNSVFSAFFDDRISVIVSSCGLDSFRDYYDGDRRVWQRGKGWTSDRYMPALAQFQDRLHELPVDFHELVAALAPRPTLIIAPLHDSNFRPDSVDRVAAEARRVYALHGVPERLRVVHPDCGHDFPPEAREEAYRWIDAALGPSVEKAAER